MSTKKYLFYILFTFLYVSCAPSFDLESEYPNIEKAIFKDFDFIKKVEVFYPDTKKRDSLKKIFGDKDLFLEELKKVFQRTSITVNSVSSTISLQDRLFKIINVTEKYSVPKEELLEIPYSAYRDYLLSNLYEYKEDANQFDIKGDSDIVAIYYNDKWNYFNFNVAMLYDAYGLQDTKKIVQLYYDDIFEPAKETWEAESIEIFKNEYQAIKDEPQYKNLDFDAYCDCLISHQQKINDTILVETSFFESETYLNQLYSCRILTSRE